MRQTKSFIAKQIKFAEKSSRLKWRDLNNSRRFLNKARNEICKPDLFGYRFFFVLFFCQALLAGYNIVWSHTLSPKLENQIIDRINFKPNLELLDPEIDPDLILIKVANSPLPMTVTEAKGLGLFPGAQKNIVDSLKNLESLEDVLDLSDILVVLADNESPQLLSDLVKEKGNLINPDEVRNPWKIIDNNKGLVFDLQSHFLKIVSSSTGQSSLIPLSVALKKGIITVQDALNEVREDLEKELNEHKKFIAKQNTSDLKNMRMKRYERTIRFLQRPDVLPLKFTLNAYGNEIVGDYDQLNNMSFGRAGEGIYVYNFNGDLEGENEINDGRFFIRGKYIGLSGDIEVGDTVVFPWLGYRAGKLKVGLFGSVDTGFILNTLYVGGILRIGKGELAAGLGIFVIPFRFLFFPGILLGSTMMRKKIRDVDVKRENPFKVINEHYEVDLGDKRGKFFRFTLGLGDPFFGFGVRSRWTDEQAKERSYLSAMNGNLARIVLPPRESDYPAVFSHIIKIKTRPTYRCSPPVYTSVSAPVPGEGGSIRCTSTELLFFKRCHSSFLIS